MEYERQDYERVRFLTSWYIPETTNSIRHYWSILILTILSGFEIELYEIAGKMLFQDQDLATREVWLQEVE